MAIHIVCDNRKCKKVFKPLKFNSGSITFSTPNGGPRSWEDASGCKYDFCPECMEIEIDRIQKLVGEK